ncbi:MAG: NifB/NifX family molybdenum-iron cluster-binding protein [Desulfonatronovibrionaceae bacterium]
MKLAVSSQGDSLQSPIDTRFGRAQGFIIYDTDNSSFEFMENKQNLNLPQGAGIQTAQNVANTGVKAVISGHIGPKAFSALSKAEIEIYFASAGTVDEALEAYKKGLLEKAQTPDKPGHW